MILIFAHRWDELAHNFTRNNSDFNLFTIKDLSIEGWAINYNDFPSSKIVIGSKTIPVNKITGMVSLVSNILPQELVHIDEPDREYVASELNAFLIYFLTQLKCPIINRPVMGSFLGCNWRHEKWLYAAQKSGFKVIPLKRNNTFKMVKDFDFSNRKIQTVKTLEDKFIGAKINHELLCKFNNLQKINGLIYQEIKYFEEEKEIYFVSANPMIDLKDRNLMDAVTQYFKNKTKDYDFTLGNTE